MSMQTSQDPSQVVPAFRPVPEHKAIAQIHMHKLFQYTTFRGQTGDFFISFKVLTKLNLSVIWVA